MFPDPIQISPLNLEKKIHFKHFFNPFDVEFPFANYELHVAETWRIQEFALCKNTS